MSETIRTITITEDRSGIFFAESDNIPKLFCAAPTLQKLFESIERVLSNDPD